MQRARLVGLLPARGPGELDRHPGEQQVQDAADAVAEAGALLDQGMVTGARGRLLDVSGHGTSVASEWFARAERLTCAVGAPREIGRR
jgi:hypothetical protein